MIPITRPMWVATAFTIIGSVLIAFGIWFAAETVLLTVDRAQATATVVAKRIDPTYFSGRTSSSDVDNSAYFMTFTFTPDGDNGTVRSELFVSAGTYNRVEVGQTISIDYVRAFPSAMNALTEDDDASPVGVAIEGGLAIGTGAIFAAWGGRFLIRSRRQRALVRRLMSGGIVTTGTVVDNDAAELRVQYNLQRRIRYRYDVAGHEQTGLSDWMSRSQALAWPKGTTGVVRYDPDRPEVSAWFGQQPDPSAAARVDAARVDAAPASAPVDAPPTGPRS